MKNIVGIVLGLALVALFLQASGLFAIPAPVSTFVPYVMLVAAGIALWNLWKGKSPV